MPAMITRTFGFRFFHRVDDRLEIISNLRDRHATKRVIDSELENEDVDLALQVRGKPLQSAPSCPAGLTGVRDFEIR